MLAERFKCETSVRFLTYLAQAGRFSSFSDLTRHYGIADQDWPYVYALLYRHLDNVVDYCAKHDMPCLPVLVVSRKARKTGTMTERHIKRLSTRMELAKYTEIGTMRNIRRHQKTCFTWAKRQYLNVDDMQTAYGMPVPAYPPSPPAGAQVYMTA